MLPTHMRRGGLGAQRGRGGGWRRGWWVTWCLGCLVLFTLAAPLLFLDLSRESRAHLGTSTSFSLPPFVRVATTPAAEAATSSAASSLAAPLGNDATVQHSTVVKEMVGREEGDGQTTGAVGEPHRRLRRREQATGQPRDKSLPLRPTPWADDQTRRRLDSDDDLVDVELTPFQTRTEPTTTTTRSASLALVDAARSLDDTGGHNGRQVKEEEEEEEGAEGEEDYRHPRQHRSGEADPPRPRVEYVNDDEEEEEEERQPGDFDIHESSHFVEAAADARQDDTAIATESEGDAGGAAANNGADDDGSDDDEEEEHVGVHQDADANAVRNLGEDNGGGDGGKAPVVGEDDHNVEGDREQVGDDASLNQAGEKGDERVVVDGGDDKDSGHDGEKEEESAPVEVEEDEEDEEKEEKEENGKPRDQDAVQHEEYAELEVASATHATAAPHQAPPPGSDVDAPIRMPLPDAGADGGPDLSPPPPPPQAEADENDDVNGPKEVPLMREKTDMRKPIQDDPEDHPNSEPRGEGPAGVRQEEEEEVEVPFDKADETVQRRREAVKEAFLHAWNSYVRHAWGRDELEPLSRKGKDWLGQGITILDSLDTLHIMGLDHEFQRARAWVSSSLRWDEKERMVSTFETTIRNLGGLLSAYGLTGDVLFLEKAQDLGARLLRAFQADDTMPKAAVGLVSGKGKNPSWTGGKAILAEVGSIQMEFLYLAKASRNASFATKALQVMDILDMQPKEQGLYPIYLDGHSGKLAPSSKVTLGALGDSFFEYLLKLWLLSDKRIPKFQRMYDEAARAILDHMTALSEPNKLTYLVELQSPGSRSQAIHRMDHLVCFAGGMFALGASERAHGDRPEDNEPFLELGKQLTATCHETYRRSPSGIGPEVIDFTPSNGAPDFASAQKAYLLRPETVESYFILWRLTHDPRYREWGWEAFQAIEKHCRHHVGYAGLRDVDSSTPEKDDTQQSFFLAETLKYLFLLFSEDDVIPLNQFVFNTEAHPLPIFKDSFVDWKPFVGSDRYA